MSQDNGPAMHSSRYCKCPFAERTDVVVVVVVVDGAGDDDGGGCGGAMVEGAVAVIGMALIEGEEDVREARRMLATVGLKKGPESCRWTDGGTAAMGNLKW
jgi:hypothetical protein